MTIEINVPIKCSTVKNIKSHFNQLMRMIILLILPLCVVVWFGSILYLQFIDQKNVGAIIIFVCSTICIIPGVLMWMAFSPIRLRCITDEVSPK